jgi:hypothetical protein
LTNRPPKSALGQLPELDGWLGENLACYGRPAVLSDDSLKLVIEFLLLMAFVGYAMHLRASGCSLEMAIAKIATAVVILGLIYFVGPIVLFFAVYIFFV